MPIGQFISYVKVRNIISKGWIFHIIGVKDSKSKTPTFDYVPIVNEFLEVFPKDPPGVSLEWENDFAIDILADTWPISIWIYRMAIVELKDFNE